jgi:hypothetical protein
MPPINATIWFNQASKQMKDSPGKATVLLAVGVVFAVMLFRLMTGQAPAAAKGSMVGPGSGIGGQSVIFTPGSSHKKGALTLSLQQWARQPIVAVSRDLFVIPYDYYPRDGTEASEPETGTGFWDQMAKSLSARADHVQQRQVLVDNVRIAASALKLDSTLLGAVPEAVINGQMAREGSVVDDFRVLKIEPRRIIVEREGVILAVRMR